jgi:hypothetical protein
VKARVERRKDDKEGSGEGEGMPGPQSLAWCGRSHDGAAGGEHHGSPRGATVGSEGHASNAYAEGNYAPMYFFSLA